MKNKKKNLKIPTSFRLDPELKKHLEQEAADHDMTPSSYIEMIVNSRHLIGIEEMPFGNYREMILKIGELDFELDSVKKKKDKIAQKFEAKKNVARERKEKIEGLNNAFLELKGRSLVFSQEEMQSFLEMIEKLKEAYPEVSAQVLVLTCLSAAVKNVDSFLATYTLKNLLT